jgi:uncharacterized protein DUF6200
MSNVDTATKAAAPKAPAATNGAQQPMVIVDLGKRSKKQVKKLRKGGGRLMDRVSSTVDQLRAEGEIDAKAEVVVFVVRERDPRTKGFLW